MGKENTDSPYQMGHDFFSYQLDCWQRSILFWNTLRERANNMMEHEQQGLPPLLNFKYEFVLDGKSLEPKTNYALVKFLKSVMCALKNVLILMLIQLLLWIPDQAMGQGLVVSNGTLK
nr:DUF3141 domain-containing protein [Legionella pneumophila]